MAQDRSKLLALLEGVAPAGAGDLLGGTDPSPVGTDAIPTGELEGSVVPPPEEVEPGGIQAILGAPDMTPEQRAELQAQLALAAREQMMRGRAV